MMANSPHLFLILSVYFTLVNAECPNGWTRFDSSCYRIYDKKLIWPEAQFACEGENAYLAEISNKQENTRVHNLIKLYHLETSSEEQSIWIGLSDVRQEGVWVWEDTKKNATFFEWDGGQPDNSGGREDCVEMRAAFGHKWNDWPCNSLQIYICERELTTPI